MNKELYDIFKKQGDTARAEIKLRLKDSPVGLLLYTFLDNCKNRNFKNREVVESIYAEELKTTTYPILENRYFKLRKHFLEEYFNVREDHEEVLAEQEKELLRCKQLVNSNQKEKAYPRLTALEKECRDKNIFELLPAILDQMIFCNQSVNRLERNEDLFVKLEEANNLLYDITRCTMLARKIYQINYIKGLKHAKKELAEIKELSLKNKNYPRFLICYHHVSLYYKLGSTDYLNDMQVISRHYSQFKKLNEKYPLMPLLGYKAHYNLYQHFHFKQISVFYHYNRCEFEEAYQAMKEMWDLVNSETDVYRIYKTEAIYFNYFSAQTAAGRYADAADTIESYIQFLKENNYSSRIPFAYVIKAILYSDAWPRTFDLRPEFLIEKLDEYIRSIKENRHVQTSKEEALLVKSKILYLNKKYREAGIILQMKEVMQYLDQMQIRELFEALYQHEAAQKTELKKKIAAKKYTIKKPQTLFNLNWMERVLKAF